MNVVRLSGWAAGGGVALLAAAMLGSGCEKPAAPPQMPPPPVTVSQPINREVIEWDEYPGRLEAVETVEVRARVSGYVESVGFREGGVVTKGDPLFVIDPRPYKAELDRARGEVARAEARRALAETEFKRTKSLVPSEAASELELEERKANLAEAVGAVTVAQAAVTAAQLNVEFTQVRAPITGRISRIFVTAGNLVTGGQGESSLLTTITSLHPIYCYVDADERSVLKYQRQARENKRPDARGGARIPAKLALLNEDAFVHEGHIDFVDNRVDPTTGTLRARAVFANEDGVMTPGLFGRLRVPGSSAYRTLLVAQSAVQADQGQHYVFVVDAENTVKLNPVKLGAAFGQLRAIQSGLTGEESVVVNGLLRARPGGKVTPTRGPMPGAGDADTLATTRVVEPPANAPANAPAIAPTTAPATPARAPATGPSARFEGRRDRAAEATPAKGAREPRGVDRSIMPFGAVVDVPLGEVTR